MGPRIQPIVFPAGAVAVAAVAHLLLDVPRLEAARAPGTLLVVLGVGLAAWAVVWQFQGGTHPEIGHATTALVTTGPYAISRNPIYVGLLLVLAGIGLMGWWTALLMLPAAAWGLHRYVVLPEEAALAHQFGEPYDRYRERTRRWL